LCSSPGCEYAFDKYDASTITSFGVPYDCDSIMHCGAYYCSWNGLPTITPKVSQLSIHSSYQFSGSRLDLCFFIKAIRFIKTQNNKERQVVIQEPVSAEGWVHSQVSLSGV